MWVPELKPESAAPVVPVGLLTTSRHCWAGCSFCRLAVPLTKVPLSRAPQGLTWESVEAAGPQWERAEWVKIRGGLSTSQPFDYWIHLIRRIRDRYDGRLAAFSPIEIWQYHVVERRSLRDLLRLLKWAGSDLLGPGGSETWSPEWRTRWAPYRIEPNEWMRVAEVAQTVGLDFAVAPMIVPHMDSTDWEDYLAVLSHLQPAHIEVKPLQAKGTPWAALGDVGAVETWDVVRRIRDARPEAVIYVESPAGHPRDAAALLGSSGADGLIVPVWEVSP